MAKPSLTRVQYVEMVNERMREHREYTKEMHAHFYPKGALPEDASGIYLEGPPVARGVLADAHAKIAAEYDFEGLPMD